MIGATILSLPRFALAGIVLPGLLAQTAGAPTDADLFDDTVLHEMRLAMHPSDWQRLKDNYFENFYYPADFQWRDIVVENIGIRSRGRGTRSDIKPSLRVDFNQFEDSQKFLGLKSLVLRNNIGDATMVHERVAMALFRKMGLPASRESHTRLYLNDRYMGLFLVVESLDKLFLKNNFGEDDGHLYSYENVEPYRFEDRGPDPAKYFPLPFKPETHEKDPDPAPLAAMIHAMSQASDANFPSAMAEYLDLTLFVKYLAVEMYMADFDGILGVTGLNNFYLYRFEKKNLHQFIAWDKDLTFDSPTRSVWKDADGNVLVRRMMNVPELRDLYLQTLWNLADATGGPGGWLEREVARALEQIRAAAYEDPFKQCGYKPCTNAEFEAAVDWSMRFVWERPNFVRKEAIAAGFQPPAPPEPPPPGPESRRGRR
jgi:hypothetical protein